MQQPHCFRSQRHINLIYDKYTKYLGILQIIHGLLIIGLEIGLVKEGHLLIYCGIGASLLFILTGSLGVGSSITKSRSMVITTMVFSIFCIIVSPFFYMSGFLRITNWLYYTMDNTTSRALFWVMVIAFIMEWIMAIDVLALFCCGMCLSSPMDKYHQYKTRPARIMGLLQILLGLVIGGIQVIFLLYKAEFYEAFSGFWAAALFFLTGTFGLESSRTKSRSMVKITMVFSIISAIFSIGPICQGSVGFYFLVAGTGSDKGVGAVGLLMCLAGISELAIAIAASCLCCQGCCQTRSEVAVQQEYVGYIFVSYTENQEENQEENQDENARRIPRETGNRGEPKHQKRNLDGQDENPKRRIPKEMRGTREEGYTKRNPDPKRRIPKEMEGSRGEGYTKRNPDSQDENPKRKIPKEMGGTREEGYKKNREKRREKTRERNRTETGSLRKTSPAEMQLPTLSHLTSAGNPSGYTPEPAGAYHGPAGVYPGDDLYLAEYDSISHDWL